MLVVSWEKVWPKGITLMPLRIDTIVILNKPFVKIEVVQVAVGLAEKWQIMRRSKLRMDNLERLVQDLSSR